MGACVILLHGPAITSRFSCLYQGPGDGKVSVKRAKLKEMTDFIVVPATHGFIMNNSYVMGQTMYFLMHGRFDKLVSD